MLDLYAGTGALGIEALSRGAARVVFVERSRTALAALRRNLEALELTGRGLVLARDVGAALADLGRSEARFDLVLIDPPYESGEDERALRALVTAGVLASHAVVVLERSRRHAVAPTAGLVLRDERRYGDTVVDRYVLEDDRAGQGGESEP